MNIFDVAEFFECTQIIDRMTGLCHPVEITINMATKVEFPGEKHHHNRISQFLNERAIF